MQKLKRQKVIAVVGPTSSGKSDLAVTLAKKYNGEVISADSRQVYRGLDIGTGKVTKREMRGVPHHLLDVADPRRSYSAAQFKRQATKAIKEIAGRGKLPIIAGGTGFYFDALFGLTVLPEVKPNATLRRELEKKNTKKLVSLLKQLDRNRAQTIDINNRRRLIRAIEIVDALGKVPKQVVLESPYDILWIGIEWPQKKLRERIEERLHARIRRGMIAEAKRLHDEGLSYKRMHALGLEYGHLADLLQDNYTREEFEERLNTKIAQYAKRQMTWFKRNKDIKWFSPKAVKSVEKLVAKFLKDKELRN